jgi:hypothetical protein
MAKNKETFTTGNEYKFTAGSHNALIRDLQRVQVLFPNPNPDPDYYREHGEFTDEAWKQEFPRFEDFLAEARVTPTIEVIWHLRQAAWLLRQEDIISYWDFRDVEDVLKSVYAAMPPWEGTRAEMWERLFKEALSREEEPNSKGTGE